VSACQREGGREGGGGREGRTGNAGTYFSVVSSQAQVDLRYLCFERGKKYDYQHASPFLSFPSLPPSPASRPTSFGSLKPTAADLARKKGEDTLPRIKAKE